LSSDHNAEASLGSRLPVAATRVHSLRETLEPYTFAPLEQAYRHSKVPTRVVWVDSIPGSLVSQVRRLVRLNRLTFSVVVDPKSSSIKAWGARIPYWLLLDAHGRVIAARAGALLTVAQIEQLLARGSTPDPHKVPPRTDTARERWTDGGHLAADRR
jgi:hypothetical protein